jgi:hypothetical protein
MTRELLIATIMLILFSCITYSQQTREEFLRCLENNEKLKDEIHELENNNRKLRQRVDYLSTMSKKEDCTEYKNRADTLLQILNLLNQKNRLLTDSLEHYYQTSNNKQYENRALQDSLYSMDRNFKLLKKRYTNLQNEIDSMTAMSEEELKIREEYRLLEVENQKKEELNRYEKQIEIDNQMAEERKREKEHENEMAEIRREKEIDKLDEDLEIEKKIEGERRLQNLSIARENRIQQELKEDYEHSKLPEHFSLIIAPSISALYGAIRDKYYSFKINNYGFTIGLGYYFDTPNYNTSGSLIGIYYNTDQTTTDGIKNLLEYENEAIAYKIKSELNISQSIELGALIKDIFELRIGYGRTTINEENPTSIEYLTTGAAIRIPVLDYLLIGIDSKFLFGLDITNVSMKLGISTMFKLDFFKW